MPENHYHVLAYGATIRERLQSYSANHTAIQESTSSCRDPPPLSPHPLSPSTYVSSSLSEISTEYNPANGYEIEDDSDLQNSSYCASQVRSNRGSSRMPSHTSTFASEAYGYEGAERWQSADLPSHFDGPFTKHDTQHCIPYNDNPSEDYRPVEWSSNVFSGIGSQFQHVGTRVFEENPFMDPVLSQDLLTSSYNFANVTVASEIASKDHLQPLIPSFTPDRPVPPAVSTATAYANIASCDTSRHTVRAVTPIHANQSMAYTLSCSSTNPTTVSNYTSDAASVDTSHFNGSSNLRHPFYNAAVGATGTYKSAQLPVALPGCTGNPTFVPEAEESSTSNSVPTRPGHETSASMAHTKTSKTKQPRAMSHSVHDQSLDAICFAKPPHDPPASVTKPNSNHRVSKCLWKGCSTTRSGVSHIENMRTHVRDTHEKPAPPTCEICGKVFTKNDSLRKHISASNHAVKIPKGTRIVRKRGADGKIYATYQVVHDYVNMWKLKKASL